MQAEPAFQWSQPVTEFIGFVSLFLANGAIGFRYAAVRNRLGSAKTDAQRSLYVSATRYAATLGLLGTLVQVVLFMTQLPRLAGRMHLSVGQLITGDPQTIARSTLLLLAVVGLVLAATMPSLLIKLCLVAFVFSLGAWNWRRQRPRLGSEHAAGLIEWAP